jgi:hypothetical protein
MPALDVKYFVASMVGEQVAKLSDANTSSEEGARLINEMKEKTGLELFQILNCFQTCMMGRTH